MIIQKIKEMLLKNGILFTKTNPLNSEPKLFQYLLNNHGIDLVLDIGANTGQFAEDIISGNYRGHIISFEPLPDAYAKLKLAAQKKSQWTAYNLAVGEDAGSITINISANSESSSVLPMLKSHSDLAPESAYIGKVEAEIVKLDDFLSSEIQSKSTIYLKIDVQGFEESVLNGAAKLLERTTILQLELSFVPLYENNLVYYEMIKRLENSGFYLYSLLPAFSNHLTGQIYQVDAVFVKKT